MENLILQTHHLPFSGQQNLSSCSKAFLLKRNKEFSSKWRIFPFPPSLELTISIALHCEELEEPAGIGLMTETYKECLRLFPS